MAQALGCPVENIHERLRRIMHPLETGNDVFGFMVTGVGKYPLTCLVLGMLTLLLRLDLYGWACLRGEEALEVHGTDTRSVSGCPHDFGDVESAVFDSSFGSGQAADHGLTFAAHGFLQLGHKIVIHTLSFSNV
jgi:hypothetical protein